MFKFNQTSTSLLPTTVHDYLPWSLYDRIPQNELGLGIPYLNSPFHFRHHTAWHTPLSQSRHTLPFLLLQAVRDDDINRVKGILDARDGSDNRLVHIDDVIDSHLNHNSL